MDHQQFPCAAVVGDLHARFVLDHGWLSAGLSLSAGVSDSGMISAEAIAATPGSAMRISRLMTVSTTQRLSRDSGRDSTIWTWSPIWHPISSWALTRLLE